MMFIYLPVGLAIGGLGTFAFLVMVRSKFNYSICNMLGHCGLWIKRLPSNLGFFTPLSHMRLLMQDTTFSAVVTVLFLRPIYKVLREGGVGVQRSAGYKSMMKTKWLTLSGAILAVLSSTALYINLLLMIMLGGSGSPWHANPYLQVGVFGVNLDSVLNDLGMLLVCGVLKTTSCAALTKCFSTAASTVKPAVANPVFDSQAYERDDSDSD